MDIFNPEHRENVAACLIAQMPTIAAWRFRYALGLPLNYPNTALGYAENFLHMMFAMPTGPYQIAPKHARALDVIMILHADHEQNASTSTVRLAGSSAASPFASVAAGIGTLWGPAHGGANEAVIRMIREIIASGKPLQHYIDRAKDRNDSFRIMGFGHRVYKTYDPRAKIIRKICHDVLQDYEGDGEIRQILEVAMELEEVARKDEYFISRNLYPNVDFYSGITFLALVIPLNMFTVLFAMARTIGGSSQWNEMMGDRAFRSGRPRQRYVGPILRDYPKERIAARQSEENKGKRCS
jgi:citrate synthase